MSSAVGNYGGVPFTITAAVFAGSGAADSGPLLWKQFPWGKYKTLQFHMVVPGGSTLQVEAFGTMDVNTASGASTGANANWFTLPAPATQAGTTTWANPMTAANPVLYVNALTVCVRLLVAAGAGNGTVFVGMAP